MSSTFAAKAGSLDRLKVRMRCGCSRCAAQIRCTARNEMPTFGHGAAGPVRRTAGRFRARQFQHAGDGFGRERRLPGGRVLSRNRPSTPASANRCCHRHTEGRLTPARGHRQNRQPLSGMEHDLRALDVLERARTIAGDHRLAAGGLRR